MAVEGFRLSPQQRLLWLRGRDSGIPVAQCSLLVEGPLEAERLRAAFLALVERHPILRTRFPRSPGLQVPLQVIEPYSTVDWREVDLVDVHRLLEEEARRELDLSAGPVLRVALAAAQGGRHLLVVTASSLCADAGSFAQLIREVGLFYSGQTLADEPVQYLQLSEWLHGLLAAPEAAEGAAYWQRTIQDNPLDIELPFERRGAGGPSSPQGRFVLEIPPGLDEITLFAAWGAFIHRITGRSRFSVSKVFENRADEDLREILGPVARAVPVPFRVDPRTSFAESVGRVRKAIAGAADWQEYFVPHDEADPARWPIGFTAVEWPVRSLAPGHGVELQALELPPDRAKLELYSVRDGDRWSAALRYDPRVLAGDAVELLAGRFETLLASAVARPGVALEALDLMHERERRSLLLAARGPDLPVPAELSVPALFASQAARTPDRIAVRSEEGWLSYEALAERSGRVASRLRAHGVGTDSLVAVLADRSPAMLIALLGILESGGAYLPLDPSHPRDRLARMLADARPVAVLVESRLREALPPAPVPRLLLEEALASPAGTDPYAVLPESLAYVLYTSGSTRGPKGVMVPHRALVSYLVWGIGFYGAEEGIAPVHSPLGFDLTVTSLFAPLLAGSGVLLLPEGRGVEELARALRSEAGFGLVKLTPAHLEALTPALAGEPLGRKTRALIIGGEALLWEALTAWREGAPETRVLNEYGPTETVVGCSVHEISREETGSGPLPIGRPIANTRIHLLDPRLETVPYGVTGEIFVGGEGVTRGYVGRPDLTAERFLPDPWTSGGRLYRTGDLARRRPDGELEFLGRADDQVKIQGVRIEPGEIEAALLGHPEVERAAVVAWGEGAGDRRLVGYVVPPSGRRPTATELRAFLADRLPEAMVPSIFLLLDSLPLTANGKVDRRGLPAPPTGSVALVAGISFPRSAVEELLAQIWAEVLGIERVGIDDDFFALGGHSLMAARVASRVQRFFGVDLPVQSLFAHPTVRAFARVLASAGESARPPASPPLAPQPRDVPPPLSFAQQRLWFLDRLLGAAGAVYNVPLAVRLRGRLDRRALALALTEIVRRHEVLRTTFAASAGEPVQVVAPPSPVQPAIIDLARLPPARGKAEGFRLAGEEARRPFRLAEEPPMRVRLLALEAEEHLALLTLHHIASDAWSLAILTREIGLLYAAFAQGRPSPLPALPVQYADFAVWQRRWLSGEVLRAELDFWRTRLRGAAEPLELPGDRPRPATRTGRGGHRPFRLSGEPLARLRALSRNQGATLFMILLAALQALLARYADRTVVAIGVPVAGRTRVEVEDLIGCFVNTLVLALDLGGGSPEGPTFSQLVARAREATLSAHAHQDLPFEKVVEELQPERDLSRTPLFQVMLAWQNAPAEALEIPGLALEPVVVESGSSRFDLTVALAETGEAVAGRFEYDRDLFDAPTIDRMAGHFAALLAELAAAPDRPLARVPSWSPAEEHQVLREWGDGGTAAEPGDTLHGLVRAQTRRAPDAIAVVHDEVHLSYGGLAERASILAGHLAARGAGPEARIGVRLERSPELVVALLAVLEAGGAYVPLDPSHPAVRLDLILEDALGPPGEAILLTRDSMAAALAGGPPREGSGKDPLPGHLAYVLYTSGSTGTPRGVAITHRTAVASTWARFTVYDRPVASFVWIPSVAFDSSVAVLFWTLGQGGTLVLPEGAVAWEPAALVALVERHQASHWLSVPSLYAAALAAQGAATALGSLTTVIVAGEACPPELVELHRARLGGAALFNEYGPTEATVWSTVEEIHGPTAARVPVGRPIPGTRALVLDRLLRSVPSGVPGELCLGGNLARGYLGAPALTAERFVPDPLGAAGERLYRSGDLARWRADGRLELLGRIDHQVKLRGVRIEPGEIEAALGRHPEIREAVVAVREHRGDRRLVAYYVPVRTPPPAMGELRAFLEQRLPPALVPNLFHPLQEIPRNPHGKVDRQALPAPEPGRPAGLGNAPRDRIELALAEIWEELLGVEPVGIRDDFFALGGHSLLAVRLMARIEERCGVALPLSRLFGAGTVEALAGAVRDRVSAPPSPLVALRAGGSRPPFFCVHPAGGSVMSYRDLARHVGPDQPFYGLQARGLEPGDGAPHERVEEMAAFYLDFVREAQPEGPYHLGGWSFGGLVAFEMARQLALGGGKVGALVLFEVFSRTPELAGDDTSLLAWNAGVYGLDLTEEELRGLAWDDQVALFAERLAAAGLLPRQTGLPYVQRLVAVHRAHVQAARDYVPGPYSGRLSLLRVAAPPAGGSPSGPRADYGWGLHTAAPVDVHLVPGEHRTLMREPHVRAVADVLRAALSSV